MESVASVLEVLLFFAFFAVFLSWSFRYLFNHEIIRNYAYRTQYSKAHINGVLETQLNAKYGLKLLRLEVDDETETNGKKDPFFGEKTGRITENVPLPKSGNTVPFDGQTGAFSSNDNLDGISGSGLQPSDKKRLHYMVGVLFSVSVTLSFELVLLLMIQLFGNVKLNLAIFRIVITALVVLATIVQPPIVISLYVNQDIVPHFRWNSPTSLFKIVSTVGLSILWFKVLSLFGAIAHQLGSHGPQSFLEERTNEIVLAGISITAMLSGVGCMSTPIQSLWIDGKFSFGKTTKSGAGGGPGSDEVLLNELIQSYNSTKMLMGKREKELNQLLLSTGGTIYDPPDLHQNQHRKEHSIRSLKGSGRKLLNRMQSFTSISRSEEDELRQEISSLRQLKNSIYTDLSKQIDVVLNERNNCASTRKPARFHTLMAACNLLFSLYCVYRIVNVLLLRLPYHYLWSTPDDALSSNNGHASETLNKNTKDALAITISKLIQNIFGYLPISETQLINQVSFILSGSLFACSFQNVLVTFKSLGRFFPTHTAAVNVNVKSWMKHLIVSEFMAIYVIATALLIRSNLPPDTVASVSKILSLSPTSAAASPAEMSAEVEFINSWFDKVFGVSCLVTFLVLVMKLFIENDTVYDGGYDEEMIIEGDSLFKQS